MNNKKIKDLLKNITKEDYLNNKVNLHLHTTFSDGKCEPTELIKQAKTKNFKYIAITDHNTCEAYYKNDFSKENFLIPGVEFDVWSNGVFFHLLAYGIDLDNEELKEFFAKNKNETEFDIIRIFAKRDIKKLINAIHNANGVAILAHPACCLTLSLEKFIKKLISYGLDGLEVYYPYPRWRKYLRFCTVQKIEKIADKYDLIKTGGTDLHGKIL